LLKNNIPLKKL